MIMKRTGRLRTDADENERRQGEGIKAKYKGENRKTDHEEGALLGEFTWEQRRKKRFDRKRR